MLHAVVLGRAAMVAHYWVVPALTKMKAPVRMVSSMCGSFRQSRYNHRDAITLVSLMIAHNALIIHDLLPQPE